MSIGPYISEATEQHTLALRLVNRGTHMCLLDGYAHVAFYDSHGMLRFRIRYTGDQMISSRRPTAVRVAIGASVFALLNKNACVSGARRDAARIELQTPAGGVTWFTFPAHMPFRWRVPDLCTTASDPGRLIVVSPFVTSVRAGLRG